MYSEIELDLADETSVIVNKLVRDYIISHLPDASGSALTSTDPIGICGNVISGYSEVLKSYAMAQRLSATQLVDALGMDCCSLTLVDCDDDFLGIDSIVRALVNTVIVSALKSAIDIQRNNEEGQL